MAARWCVVVRIADDGPLDTRTPASVGHLKCRETATSVRGRERYARLGDNRGRRSTPRGEPKSWGAHGSPAGRTRGRKKRCCCVTTRWRNFPFRHGFGRCFNPLTARGFRPGVLGLDLGALATFGLPAGRLPATHQAEALGRLAIPLVPPPRLVLAIATLAQTDSQTRPTPPGRRGKSCITLRRAHGSPEDPQGQPEEDGLTFSSGVYQ